MNGGHKKAERVGYIGLGNMGGGIATHLARAGVNLTVYDINSDAIEQVAREGAKPASSLKSLVAKVDIVVICVLDGKQVMDVVIGSGGVLENTRPGQVIIIQSTVTPQTVFAVAEAAEPYGVDVIDAPVSGNIEDRLNGTLAVIVGGEERVVERCRPILETIGSTVLHVGQLGSGEVGKLANNAIMQTTRFAAIEIMRFASVYGVSEEMVRAVAKVSSGASWVLDNWPYLDEQTRAARGDHAPQLRDVVEAAEVRGLELPLCHAAISVAADTESARRKLLESASS